MVESAPPRRATAHTGHARYIFAFLREERPTQHKTNRVEPSGDRGGSSRRRRPRPSKLKVTAQATVHPTEMHSASSECRRVGSTDAVAHQAALAFAGRVLAELPARTNRTHELSVAGSETGKHAFGHTSFNAASFLLRVCVRARFPHGRCVCCPRFWGRLF